MAKINQDYLKESGRVPGMSYIVMADSSINTANYTTGVTWFFDALTNGSASVTNSTNTNKTITIKGTKYTLKNCVYSRTFYNLHDVIAIATSAGYSLKDIDAALEQTYQKYKTTETDDSIKNEDGFYISYDQLKKEAEDKGYHSYAHYLNANTVPGIGSVANKLYNEHPETDASIITKLNPDGVTYSFELQYYDPVEKKNKSKEINPEDLKLNKDGSISEDALDAYLNTTGLVTNITTGLNKESNESARGDLADAVLSALNKQDFTINAFNTLTDADKAAISAAAPDIRDFKAINQSKDANIYSALINNLKQNSPDTLKRMSYEQLKGIADVISQEEQGVTQRNISNSQAQLLQQIAKDPELYNSLVQQTRADNAAGTVAGQRATNAQAAATTADASYDEAASKLYSSLFSGENGNVAQELYNAVKTHKVDGVEYDIKNKLDQAMTDANNEALKVEELRTVLSGLEDAIGVDVAKYGDQITERQAAAGEKANSLIDLVTGNYKLDSAEAKAALNAIGYFQSEGNNIINNAANSGNQYDASTAVQELIKYLYAPSDKVSPEISKAGDNLLASNTKLDDATVEHIISTYGSDMGSQILGYMGSKIGQTNGTAAKPNEGDYDPVDIGSYQKANQIDNKQYNDIVNSDVLNYILSDKTISEFTKAKTLEQYLQDTGLDVLTYDGLNALYTEANKEATQQSNQIFNQAQRAYIAAITAGDAKTAEQLTRLAASASSSKGNLYAASALANQYKQQSGLSSNGRQLATDFLNQQSFNKSNKASIGNWIQDTQSTYLGTGNKNYNNTTLYDTYLQHKQNATTAGGYYGSLANKIMGGVQDVNSWNVKNNVDNWNQLSELASAYRNTNINAAADNIANAETKKEIEAAAKASKAIASSK